MAGIKTSGISSRLTLLSFLEFAIWGAYLTSVGIYLFKVGLGEKIGWFFAIQGIASIFMPAIMGVIADKWVSAQKLLSFCHLVTALSMATTGYVAMQEATEVKFGNLFLPYSIGVAFFMPTIALSNSVSYTLLGRKGKNVEKTFPRIRVFGTIGFIASMWAIDLLGFKDSYNQFFVSSALGLTMAIYSMSMPDCPPNKTDKGRKIASMMGADALKYLKEKNIALFFLFSMLLGCALQISNGYAGAYISSFTADAQYAETFAVRYPIIMTSLSQISETLCLLLIPFFLTRYGIKKVMIMAMTAWALRFCFLAMGNPGDGVWLFVLSMLVYGIAFDFFNISGSLYVNRTFDKNVRSSAQGLFMFATNGLGASVGMLLAQKVVDYSLAHSGWSTAWYIFATYTVAITLLFALFFKEKRNIED